MGQFRFSCGAVVVLAWMFLWTDFAHSEPDDFSFDPDVVDEGSNPGSNPSEQERSARAPVARETPATPESGSPEVPLRFITMDRGAAGSEVGGAFSVSLASDEVGSSNGFRFDAHGRHALQQVPLSIYWAVPLSIASFQDDTEMALGNIEGGVLHLLSHANHTIVLRGGLTLPTASADAGFFANLSGLFVRLADVAAISPETLWLRTSGSALGRAGRIVYRLDLGLDLPLSDADGFEAEVFLRVNGAVGLQLGRVQISTELVTSGAITGDGDLTDRFFHSLAGAIHFPIRHVQAYAGLITPLDSDFIGEVFVLTAGAALPLR